MGGNLKYKDTDVLQNQNLFEKTRDKQNNLFLQSTVDYSSTCAEIISKQFNLTKAQQSALAEFFKSPTSEAYGKLWTSFKVKTGESGVYSGLLDIVNQILDLNNGATISPNGKNGGITLEFAEYFAKCLENLVKSTGDYLSQNPGEETLGVNVSKGDSRTPISNLLETGKYADPENIVSPGAIGLPPKTYTNWNDIYKVNTGFTYSLTYVDENGVKYTAGETGFSKTSDDGVSNGSQNGTVKSVTLTSKLGKRFVLTTESMNDPVGTTKIPPSNEENEEKVKSKKGLTPLETAWNKLYSEITRWDGVVRYYWYYAPNKTMSDLIETLCYSGVKSIKGTQIENLNSAITKVENTIKQARKLRDNYMDLTYGSGWKTALEEKYGSDWDDMLRSGALDWKDIAGMKIGKNTLSESDAICLKEIAKIPVKLMLGGQPELKGVVYNYTYFRKLYGSKCDASLHYNPDIGSEVNVQNP